MRVDLPKLVSLSVLLSLILIQAFVKCDEANPQNNQVGELKGAQNLKGFSPSPSSKKVSPSPPATSPSEPRQRYQLKFLTPYSHDPVRLKDHYGRKGNTRWYKFGSQNFTDNIPHWMKFYSTEDEWINMGANKVTHLLLMTYDSKSHFVLDHYEPTHQDAHPRNSNQNYDYDYTFESNIDREIYTLLYLSDFQLFHVPGNATIDNINQEYSDVTCRISLVLPSALSDEHSAILYERLEKSLHLRLKLIEPTTDESNAPADTMSKDKDRRNIRFKPIPQRSLLQEGPIPQDFKKSGSSRIRRNVANPSSSASSTPSTITTTTPLALPQLFEMEIVEGPLRVFRDNFKGGLNASCSLSLRDFDHTFAFNSFINSPVFSSSAHTEKSNAASASIFAGSGRLFTFMFVVVSFLSRLDF